VWSPASGAITRWMASCRRAVDAWAFPWSCEICGATGDDGPFCDACRAELIGASDPSRTCRRCAMPVGPHGDRERGCSECRGKSLGFDEAVALGPYQGPIRDLCLRMKHERDGSLAPWLADLLVEARGETLRASGAAFVAPIPLHWRRRLARGYNQAEALADRLARTLQLRSIRPLRRVAATGTLAGAGRVERHKRMHKAFRVRPTRRRFEGATILLVDDILTSGATCGAAARVLKRAGAARVIVAVIGRAEGRA